MEQQILASPLVVALDLVGTFVFALSGGATGFKHRFDVFGILVLSYVAGNVGGITRDVLIGAVPPSALNDWRYIAVSILAGLLAFRWSPVLDRVRSPVLVLDGAGLALFAVSGALKALDYHLNPAAAVVLGMLTGVGGGMVRDVLSADVPVVLRSEVYAVAALAGATVVVVGDLAQLPSVAVAVVGAGLCFGLRMVAIWRGWQLPVARPREAASVREKKDHTSS